MRRSTDLAGRDALVREVAEHLAAGRSVLLSGPEAIGKSAIIAAVCDASVTVIDPFEHVTRRQAAEIRRALDRGAVYVGATRVTTRRALGAVGRILWRFVIVRVRELPDSVVVRLVAWECQRAAGRAPETRWIREIARLSRGRPGYAIAMARFAAEWQSRSGSWPLPAFALAATREEAAVVALQRGRLSSRRTELA